MAVDRGDNMVARSAFEFDVAAVLDARRTEDMGVTGCDCGGGMGL